MPRKTQTSDLSGLLKGASFEDAPDFIPADPIEPPKVHERAEPTEHPDASKRANPSEGTNIEQRATALKRTTDEQRARTTESTTQPERFTFTHRVRITDGFQYRCTFEGVQAWADRNWLQYDGSPPKGYVAGPALYLPDGQICRVGDWLVREETQESASSPAATRMVVYSDKEMQHFFSVVPA